MADIDNATGNAQPDGAAAAGAGSTDGTPAAGTPTPTPAAGGSPVADAAIKAAAAADGSAGPAWYEGLPAESHEKLRGFGTLDDALAVLERGGDFQPAKSVEEFNIDLGKNEDGVDINTLEDGGALDRFKQFALDNGITPKQAQDLVGYQQKELADAEQQLIEVGEEQLKTQWGNNYQPNKEKGLVALTTLDRKLGGRLSQSMKQSGAINDPVVIEALYEIGQMIGEDNLGAGGPGGGAPDKEETVEDAYTNLFNKGKQPK